MPLTVQSHNRNIKEKGRCPVLSENKRRRSSSPDFMGRIRQSARHIETEAKEGARRVQHEAQERVRNMTPQQKNGWRKAGRIIGTLLLVFVVTLTIFSGIFNLGIGTGSFIGGGVCTFDTIADVGFVGAFIAFLALLYCAFVLIKHMKAQSSK